MDEQKSDTNRLSRREMLLRVGGAGLLGVLGRRRLFSLPLETQSLQVSQPSAVSPVLSQDDDDFLQEMEKRNFQYFWDQANPQTGLIRDRCNVAKNDNSIVASIAATGFGLTAFASRNSGTLFPFLTRATGSWPPCVSSGKKCHASRLLLSLC